MENTASLSTHLAWHQELEPNRCTCGVGLNEQSSTGQTFAQHFERTWNRSRTPLTISALDALPVGSVYISSEDGTPWQRVEGGWQEPAQEWTVESEGLALGGTVAFHPDFDN